MARARWRTHAPASVYVYIVVRNAARSSNECKWIHISDVHVYIYIYKYMCISYTYMYVYTQTDTDRHVILNVSMPRAPHSLPEHYHTPVSQQQPLHCVVIQAKYVTGVTFFLNFFQC